MSLSSTVTRRSALASGAIVFSLALAACGGKNSSSSASSDNGSSSDSGSSASGDTTYLPAAEGKTQYPLELKSAFGTSTLKERPTRIAAVTGSQDDAEALGALGVTPYLAGEFTRDVWLTEAIPTPIVERYSRTDEDYPLEQIAAAKPDLIIAYGDLGTVYDQLTSIAPVIASESNSAENQRATDWEKIITTIGEALDLQDGAAAAIAKWKKFWEDFTAEHETLHGKSISYLVYYGDQGGVQIHNTPKSPAGNVFENMGMTLAPGLSELKYRQELSPETYSTIDADVILFSDNSDGNHAKITEDPLFKNLEAVKNNRLVVINNLAKSDPSEPDTFAIDGVEYEGNVPWALARSGPLSGTWAAEKLAPALEKYLGN